MKHLFTLLLILITVTAFSQAPDSTKTPPPKVEYDTLKIDLVPFGAFDRLRSIEQRRMQVQAEAMVLQERTKALDAEWNVNLEGEARHDKRFDPKREVVKFDVIGTYLVIIQNKKPAVPFTKGQITTGASKPK